MKKNKLSALVIAAVCALTVASCSKDESSSENAGTGSSADSSTVSSAGSDASSDNGSSLADEDSKAADSSDADSSDADSSENDSSSKEDASSSSAADSKPDSASDSKPDNNAPVYDPGLIKLVKEIYSSEEITGESKKAAEQIQDSFDKPGVLNVCASIKTEDLFDPFDDLLDDISMIAKKYPNTQDFILTELFEKEEYGKKIVDTNGFIFGLAFGCKDDKEGKELYDLIVDDEIRTGLSPDDKDYAFEFDDKEDSNMLIAQKEDSIYFLYLRKGSSVYIIAYYKIEDLPEGVTTKYDYVKEFEKLCAKLGVKSPTELKLSK